MRKTIKRLNLNKKTISNLDMSQLNTRKGGGPTNGNNCITLGCSPYCSGECTHVNTCHGHTCGGNCTHDCVYTL